MLIAGREIGPGRPPFIIGEAGLNHGGSLDKALKMIEVAKAAGCDACKFQTYKAAEFCRPDDPMYATFERCELPVEAWAVLKAECDRLEVIFLSTPQNRSDLDILLKVGIPAIKVGSDDFCNLPLLADYARERLPMILSCGMSTLQDCCNAFVAIGGLHNVALLICSSQYPCAPEEVRLARIAKFWQQYHPIPVGFSDHTHVVNDGNVASIAAVGLGACIFERHFMLGETGDSDAPDIGFACTPEDLSQWVSDIRLAHTMLGDGSFTLTPRELESKRKFQRRAGEQIRGSHAERS